jgi:2-keto-myo-inositol isomerase
MENLSRRKILGTGLAATFVASTMPFASKASPTTPAVSPFKICLNTSTIMKQNIGLMNEIELAAKAGFKGIEVWTRTMEAFVSNGGKLADVKKKAADLGISLENVIGFSNWLSDDPNLRAAALEQTKREMDMLNQVGCNKMAAPPFGSTINPVGLEMSAARYKDLCALGASMAVQPQLEIWGFSNNIHLVGQSLFIAAESGQDSPAILADVYHLHKGGSASNALNMIPGNQIKIFHMNDYPAEPGREKINDSHRVMPGDGVAPMNKILKTLISKNTPITLSLELFSEKYWAMAAKEVLAIGFDKMQTAIEKAK